MDENNNWIFESDTPLAGLSKTGDHGNSQWVLLVMLVAAGGLLSGGRKRRRKNKK